MSALHTVRAVHVIATCLLASAIGAFAACSGGSDLDDALDDDDDGGGGGSGSASSGELSWRCCEESGAYCRCDWTEQDCLDDEHPTDTCAAASRDPSERAGLTPVCCTTESLFRDGALDCSCFGGYFETGERCDGDLWVGEVESCTEPFDPPPGEDD